MRLSSCLGLLNDLIRACKRSIYAIRAPARCNTGLKILYNCFFTLKKLFILILKYVVTKYTQKQNKFFTTSFKVIQVVNKYKQFQRRRPEPKIAFATAWKAGLT